ncbi:MAG: sigma-70 family RNA polymerase sigma factor [Deltaproteobacteria bacterium]|nr:sigma-70 family RNA polymerase sigma factor [Deltaproteobacteria bacterium]
MDKFSAFYQAQRRKLFYYLMRMTGNYYLSGDIMQESFTRLLKHYGPEVQDVALLYKIARNAVLDHIRKNSRNSKLEEDDRPDRSIDSESLLMVRQEYHMVLAAMKKLEAGDREIMALLANGEFSYHEIAQITGISEGNVRVKVHRARLKLKGILQQEKET